MATGKPNPNELDARLRMYALLVEMADRVSQRRQAANSFYLSVNTALVAASAYISGKNATPSSWVLGLAGACVCALWMRNILSYKTLNSAKFDVIQEIENRLPEQPYSTEWSLLTDREGKRHNPFHETEALVPLVFLGVHGVQSAILVPWIEIIHGLSAAFSSHS